MKSVKKKTKQKRKGWSNAKRQKYLSTKLFFVTSVRGRTEEGSGSERRRCWGYYLTLEDAIDSVKRNPWFYNEAGGYDYVCIEELEPGVTSCDYAPLWYSLTRHGTRYYAKKVKAPAFSKQIVGYALG